MLCECVLMRDAVIAFARWIALALSTSFVKTFFLSLWVHLFSVTELNIYVLCSTWFGNLIVAIEIEVTLEWKAFSYHNKIVLFTWEYQIQDVLISIEANANEKNIMPSNNIRIRWYLSEEDTTICAALFSMNINFNQNLCPHNVTFIHIDKFHLRIVPPNDPKCWWNDKYSSCSFQTQKYNGFRRNILFYVGFPFHNVPASVVVMTFRARF